MKVLLIGSGGREHALAWKISKSPRLEKLFSAPGSDAIARWSHLVKHLQSFGLEVDAWIHAETSKIAARVG